MIDSGEILKTFSCARAREKGISCIIGIPEFGEILEFVTTHIPLYVVHVERAESPTCP